MEVASAPPVRIQKTPAKRVVDTIQQLRIRTCSVQQSAALNASNWAHERAVYFSSSLLSVVAAINGRSPHNNQGLAATHSLLLLKTTNVPLL